MLSVGVRDLKNQLSQYLQYVKEGEKVYITEHNRVIAEISLPSENSRKTDVDAHLEHLAAEGKLIKAKRNTSIQQQVESSESLDWISAYKDTRDSKEMADLAKLVHLRTNKVSKDFYF